MRKKDIWVYAATGPKLTIEAGSEVRFQRYASLKIGWSSSPGTLVVEGTETEPVLFTSDEASPQAGDWGGIDFYGQTTNDTHLANATFEYCGSDEVGACLNVQGSARIGIDNVTVQESEGYGVMMNRSASFSNGSSKLSVHNTADHAIEIAANQVGTLPEGGSFSGDRSSVWVRGEQVDRTQTWPNLGIPYMLSSDRVWVYGSTAPELTIVAGTELYFQPGGGIEVGWSNNAGTLKVLGSVTEPVIMSSSSTSPNPGSWRGVTLSADATSESVIRNTTLAYCGDSNDDACLRVKGSSVTVNDLTIEHSGGYGAYLTGAGQFGPGSSNLTISGSDSYPVRIAANRAGTLPLGGDYTANGSDGIFIEQGTVSRTQSWNDLGVPYVIGAGKVFVYGSTSPTLTLMPGIEIRMGSNAELQIGWSTNAGTLIAEGGATAPIVFTAHSASPQPGYWKGIIFSSQATIDSRLSNVTVEYGTNNIVFQSMVPNGLTDLKIRGADECGVRFDRVAAGSRPNLLDPARNNTFENNTSNICT